MPARRSTSTSASPRCSPALLDSRTSCWRRILAAPRARRVRRWRSWRSANVLAVLHGRPALTPVNRSRLRAAAASATSARGRIARHAARWRRRSTGLDEPAVEKIADEQQEDPFQVLIATMLSAQTRDAVTASASRRLFARGAHAARHGAALRRGNREPDLSGELLPQQGRSHRRSLPADPRPVRRRVPRTMEELLTLPGVGRKTANLVLILAHRSGDNICVDTHVHRISNRLGLGDRRGRPRRPSTRSMPWRARRWWPVMNLYLVTWGQNVCRPVYPLCGSCAIADLCPRIGVTRKVRHRLSGSRLSQHGVARP